MGLATGPDDDTSQAVLRLLVHHPAAAGDPAVACRLLSSGKAVGEAVAEACAGRLAVDARLRTTDAAESLGLWLARHGGLLRALDMRARQVEPPSSANEPAPPSPEAVEPEGLAAAAVAAGLSRAPRGGLRRLRSLGWSVDSSEPPPLSQLSQLVVGRDGGLGGLTRLDLTLGKSPISLDAGLGLAALTGLCSLSLTGLRAADQAHILLPAALSGMSMLTRVEFFACRLDAEVLWYLPHGVASLSFSHGTFCGGGVQLGHLTALTSLVLDQFDEREEPGVPLLLPWALPPSLVSLESACCLTPAEPLLGLTNLRTLGVKAEPDELAQLHTLTSLTSLSVAFDFLDSLPLSGTLAACRGLSVRGMEVALYAAAAAPDFAGDVAAVGRCRQAC